MKTFCLILVALIIPIICFSQNLVLNHDFELNQSDNFDGLSNVSKCIESDTPDLFNKKNSNSIFDNYIGGIEPFSGNFHIGIFIYRNNVKKKKKPVREFVQLKLKKELKKGTTYQVEFNVALDCESNFLTNSVQAYFSKKIIKDQNTKDLFKLRPQIKNGRKNYPKTNQWTKVTGLYKAKGGEKFIILGNFRKDKSTSSRKVKVCTSKTKKDKWKLRKKERAAYLYIDNVSVIPQEATDKKQEKNKTEIVAKVDDKQNDTIQNDIMVHEKPDENNFSDIENNKVKKGNVFILRNVQFDYDKYELKNSSFNELNKLVKVMLKDISFIIEIRGHTDNTGNETHNTNLSLNRAKAVKNYLVNKGISEKRINCLGFGSKKPISSNNTAKGRELNRRVEFMILND